MSEEETQSNSSQRAAISSFRFPLNFIGTNQLLNNDGGGLSAIGTVVKVNGRLVMRNNTARYGGGVHLEDHCMVWWCGMVLHDCVCVCVYMCLSYLNAFVYK